eukprot:TRINITY_DN1823_c0_g1_i1.p1 TRINITY_DN1823_c0_g1~~TRINITY_DN1823_c0_g1_i1.p1  ORF type:complete len:371 (+),score=82.40 TRINITY_DN1823_c0_g1_i1:89-1201(+)
MSDTAMEVEKNSQEEDKNLIHTQNASETSPAKDPETPSQAEPTATEPVATEQPPQEKTSGEPTPAVEASTNENSSSETSTAPQDAPTVPPKKLKLKLSSGSHEAQGDRHTMEDTHVHIDDLRDFFPSLKENASTVAFYGVYDGHGGKQTAELAKEIVHKNLVECDNFALGKYTDAIKDAFSISDQQILEKADKESWTTNGCTAVSCLIIDNEVYLANLGDAEMVAGVKDGDKYHAIQLTEKHKASGDKEKERIKSLGGVVIYGRIFGTLAVSRSFGDAEFKKPKTGADFVSSEPFVQTLSLEPEKHSFLIIACDGLWDVLKYEEAVSLVVEKLTEKPDDIAKALVDKALEKGTQDNVTVVVVLLHWLTDE